MSDTLRQAGRTPRIRKLHARTVAVTTAAIVLVLELTGCSPITPSSAPTSSHTPPITKSFVTFGVSNAQTGRYAVYGRQIRQAFEFAAGQINAEGGINGHPIWLRFQDSRSDPSQSAAVAQQFVSDPDISLVFGDLTSAASVAAAPVYTRGKVVQYGFLDSDPTFTAAGSPYQWSSAVSVGERAAWLTDYIKKQGVASVAYLKPATGAVPAYAAFRAEARRVGLKITDAEAVGDSAKDYRTSVSRVIADRPHAVVAIGPGVDVARVVTQLHATGYTGTFYSGQDDQAIDDTGAAAGSVAGFGFDPTSTDAMTRDFVEAFEKAYPKDSTVTAVEAAAFDALHVAVAAAERGGTTRAGILRGFEELKDVPSLLYGKVTFDPTTRRLVLPPLTSSALQSGGWTAMEP